MPQLSPLNWIMLLILFWFMFFLMLSMIWWYYKPSFLGMKDFYKSVIKKDYWWVWK
uniref:ATP synthase F0 subunit 8 n=1 Tax=Epitonium scalare TaxID=494602 RepID=A0A6B9MUV9_9CAEN|nr:ATP synthase F0 subunit 8 [Epitonium scalare]